MKDNIKITWELQYEYDLYIDNMKLTLFVVHMLVEEPYITKFGYDSYKPTKLTTLLTCLVTLFPSCIR